MKQKRDKAAVDPVLVASARRVLDELTAEMAQVQHELSGPRLAWRGAQDRASNACMTLDVARLKVIAWRPPTATEVAALDAARRKFLDVAGPLLERERILKTAIREAEIELEAAKKGRAKAPKTTTETPENDLAKVAPLRNFTGAPVAQNLRHCSKSAPHSMGGDSLAQKRATVTRAVAQSQPVPPPPCNGAGGGLSGNTHMEEGSEIELVGFYGSAAAWHQDQVSENIRDAGEGGPIHTKGREAVCRPDMEIRRWPHGDIGAARNDGELEMKPYRQKKHDRLITPGASANEIAADFAAAPFDHAMREAEKTWGIDRLPELVSPDLAAKFGKAMAVLNDALDRGDPEAAAAAAANGVKGIQALDAAARAAGHQPLKADFMEFDLDGFHFVVVRDAAEWPAAAAERPTAAIFTLREVGNALKHYGASVAAVKAAFPGAEVTAIRQPSKLAEELEDNIPW